MAEYEVNDGDEKFTVNADSDAQASAAVANYQFMNFTGKFILLIFLIVPVLCAKLVGIIFAALGKIPAAGRIVQTVIVAISGAVVGLMFFAGIYSVIVGVTNGQSQAINAVGLCGGFAFAGFWYYLYHFHVVQYMGIKIFSDLLTRSFSIAFYGSILLAIIGGIIAKGEITGVFIGVLIAFIAAIVFYINKTKQLAAEAAEVRGPIPMKQKSILFIIALAITGAGLVLGIIGDITSNIQHAADVKAREAKLTEMIAKDPGMAILRRDTPFKAVVTSPIKGMTSEISRVEIELPQGASITVTYFFTSGDDNNAMVNYNNKSIEVESKDFKNISPE